MPYPTFDRTRLKLKPLSEREHDMTLAELLNLDDDVPPFDDPALEQVLANKDAFIDHLAAGRRLGRTNMEITGLQQNFYRLLSACTGRDIESLEAPNPPGEPSPGTREEP